MEGTGLIQGFPPTVWIALVREAWREAATNHYNRVDTFPEMAEELDWVFGNTTQWYEAAEELYKEVERGRAN